MNNKTKALILAGAFVAASAANAQVTIYLSGSTAFRAEVFNSIKALYGGSPTITPAGATTSSSKVTYVGNGGNIGTLFGGQTVTIKTAFSGSVEGVVNVVGAANPPGVTQPTYLNADNSTDSNTVADFVFSDVFQNTTDYNDGLYAALDDYQCGVVCFAWTRNVAAASSGITNITHQQAQQLFASGSIAKSFWTGNLADTTPVYLSGRYKLSGTRLTYQADCGYGANADATLYMLDGSHNPILDTVGRTGGGDVATILKDASATVPFIGTLGTSDAAGVNGGANKLTYNGVAFSKAAVQNGQYSLWGYEHIFPRPGTSATKLKLIVGTTNPSDPKSSNGLVNAIDTALSTSANNVQLSTMNVARNADGAPISP
jgi:hypothetical protein